MIMDVKCPYCESDDVDINSPMYEWSNSNTCIITWDGSCMNCHADFVVSEELQTTSRIVAKDSVDLNRLLEEEACTTGSSDTKRT